MKSIQGGVVFVAAFLCVSVAFGAQSPQGQAPAMTGAKAEQFEKAHEDLFLPQADRAKETGRLSEAVSKFLPGVATPSGEVTRKNFIDEHIFGRIERDGIPHAGLSTDEEFIRRVYLDATGLVPDPEAVRAFVTSTDPDKRDQVVDSLIGTEEFAEQWAWFWGDLFRLMNHAGSAKDAFQFWLKEWLQVDRPYNDVVTDILTGSAKGHSAIPQLGLLARILRNGGLKGRQPTGPNSFGKTTNRLDALDEMAVEIGRVFLGIQMDCITCHDGPGHYDTRNLYLGNKSRKDFAQQAAFAGQMRLLGGFNGDNGDSVLDELAKGYDTGNDAPWHTPSEFRFPRTGRTYEPAFILTGERPRPGANRRVELARMVTTHPQFARATVNLIWGKLMSVGFVEPYDGFDLARLDPKNPPPAPWTVQPNNPELLEALAEDFRANNYSVHHLFKAIMGSSAYQLSPKFPGEWKDSYVPYYARKYVRVMTGPEIVDTIAQVTGRPYDLPFKDTHVLRVKQLTDMRDLDGRVRSRGKKNTAAEGPELTVMLSSFLQGNRNSPAPVGNQVSLLQATLLMSLKLVNDRVLSQNGGRVEQLLVSGQTDEEVIESMFLATLARWPTPEERQHVLEAFGFEEDRRLATENLLWTLLNGTEFVLNH